MLSRVTRCIASPAVLRSQKRTGYASRYARHLATTESGVSNIVDDKDSFKVDMHITFMENFWVGEKFVRCQFLCLFKTLYKVAYKVVLLSLIHI